MDSKQVARRYDGRRAVKEVVNCYLAFTTVLFMLCEVRAVRGYTDSFATCVVVIGLPDDDCFGKSVTRDLQCSKVLGLRLSRLAVPD